VGFSGKTGTSQVVRFKDISKTKCEDLEYKLRHHGWFVGYAPKVNPQIVVAVIGEHICHGSSAAPVVRDVIDAYFKKNPIPESERLLARDLRPKKRKIATPVSANSSEEKEKKKNEEKKNEENEEESN
jgi:penicillin-binding protein 2